MKIARHEITRLADWLVFLVDDFVRADSEEDNRFFRKVEITVAAGLFLVWEKFFALFANGKDDAEILINPFASQAPEVVPVLLFKGFGVVVGVFENGFNLLLNLLLQGSIGFNVVTEQRLVVRRVFHFLPKTSS